MINVSLILFVDKTATEILLESAFVTQDLLKKMETVLPAHCVLHIVHLMPMETVNVGKDTPNMMETHAHNVQQVKYLLLEYALLHVEQMKSTIMENVTVLVDSEDTVEYAQDAQLTSSLFKDTV